MSEVSVEERRARPEEISAHPVALRAAAAAEGLTGVSMREDGTVVVHDDRPGYRGANRFSSAASIIVGAYVHVITDDVPAAAGARPL